MPPCRRRSRVGEKRKRRDDDEAHTVAPAMAGVNASDVLDCLFHYIGYEQPTTAREWPRMDRSQRARVIWNAWCRTRTDMQKADLDVLLQCGLDVGAVVDDGETAIGTALAWQNTNAATLLLDLGMSNLVQQCDGDGNTVLMSAIRYSQSHEIVARIAKLCDAATLNAHNKAGMTAIALAAETDAKHNFSFVEALLPEALADCSRLQLVGPGAIVCITKPSSKKKKTKTKSYSLNQFTESVQFRPSRQYRLAYNAQVDFYYGSIGRATASVVSLPSPLYAIVMGYAYATGRDLPGDSDKIAAAAAVQEQQRLWAASSSSSS
jgi:hypothetical protein